MIYREADSESFVKYTFSEFSASVFFLSSIFSATFEKSNYTNRPVQLSSINIDTFFCGCVEENATAKNQTRFTIIIFTPGIVESQV